MKRSVLSVLWAVAPVVIMAAAQLISCGRDSPTDSPSPPKPEQKDYVAYFFDGNAPVKLFSYHVATRHVDSSLFPFQKSMPPVVSADGRFIYVPSGATVSVLDTGTLQTVSTLPSIGNVAVSQDNRYLVVTGQLLTLYRVADYSVVFTDSIKLRRGWFAKNSKRFYSYYGEGGYQYIYVLDIENNNTVKKIRLPDAEGVEQVLPSIGETQLYLYRRYPTFHDLYLLDIYDRSLDSVIFTWWLFPGAGMMRLTPDGKTLYLTDPGRDLIGPPPHFSLGLITTSNLSFDSLAVLAPSCNDGITGHISKELAITPDGRYLLATNRDGPGRLLVYDLATKQTDTAICLGNDKMFVRLTMQNGL